MPLAFNKTVTVNAIVDFLSDPNDVQRQDAFIESLRVVSKEILGTCKFLGENAEPDEILTHIHVQMQYPPYKEICHRVKSELDLLPGQGQQSLFEDAKGKVEDLLPDVSDIMLRNNILSMLGFIEDSRQQKVDRLVHEHKQAEPVADFFIELANKVKPEESACRERSLQAVKTLNSNFMRTDDEPDKDFDIIEQKFKEEDYDKLISGIAQRIINSDIITLRGGLPKFVKDYLDQEQDNQEQDNKESRVKLSRMVTTLWKKVKEKGRVLRTERNVPLHLELSRIESSIGSWIENDELKEDFRKALDDLSDLEHNKDAKYTQQDFKVAYGILCESIAVDVLKKEPPMSSSDLKKKMNDAISPNASREQGEAIDKFSEGVGDRIKGICKKELGLGEGIGRSEDELLKARHWASKLKTYLKTSQQKRERWPQLLLMILHFIFGSKSASAKKSVVDALETALKENPCTGQDIRTVINNYGDAAGKGTLNELAVAMADAFKESPDAEDKANKLLLQSQQEDSQGFSLSSETRSILIEVLSMFLPMPTDTIEDRTEYKGNSTTSSSPFHQFGAGSGSRLSQSLRQHSSFQAVGDVRASKTGGQENLADVLTGWEDAESKVEAEETRAGPVSSLS